MHVSTHSAVTCLLFLFMSPWIRTGTGWGEQGYARVRMTYTNDGACGMYQVGAC